MESFINGWLMSCGWFLVLVPIYIVKGAFRASID